MRGPTPVQEIPHTHDWSRDRHGIGRCACGAFCPPSYLAMFHPDAPDEPVPSEPDEVVDQ